MTEPPAFPYSLASPREGKPRRRGQTWISLFGEGPRSVEDLLTMAGPFIDRAKLAYGSSLLADRGALRAVLDLLHKAQVDVYPGGTLVEMAIREGRYEDLLAWARDTGFTSIEVCDGVIELPPPARRNAIERARAAGFRVTTVVQEVVRKPLAEVVPLRERIRRAEEDLAAGATDVHIVFQALLRGETPSDVVGPIKREQVRALSDAVGTDRLVWEATRLDDQLYYLRTVGPDASLGHVPPAGVVQLEAQRRDLGYESFWSKVWRRPHWD